MFYTDKSNGQSKRYYRLKFADTYYGEMTHYGLYRLAWADSVRKGTFIPFANVVNGALIDYDWTGLLCNGEK